MFHRLNVIRLRIPALRERREDIPMLTRHFLQVSAKQLGVAKRISDAALEVLSQYPFSGNVRQLENICHWLTVMAPGQVVEAKDLPPAASAPQEAALQDASVLATERLNPTALQANPGLLAALPMAVPAAAARSGIGAEPDRSFQSTSDWQARYT